MADLKEQLTGLRRNQQFMFILVFALAAIIMWVVGSLISSQKSTGVDPELLKLARQLNPNIDETVISQLEDERAYQPSELLNFPIYKIIKSKDGKVEEKVTIDVDEDAFLERVVPVQTPILAPQPTNDFGEGSIEGVPVEVNNTQAPGSTTPSEPGIESI